MPAEFNKLGISFQYPENWALDENDALAGHRSVTVFSPGGAFWSISVHPRSADPVRLADVAVGVMKEEYKDLEVKEVRENVAGREMVGYDLNFYCLDLTNTASVRCLRCDRATYTVFCQAEDREFDKVRAVFHAMTTSFLSSLRPLKRWDR
ncbi:MAG: hypothetical protein ABIP48_23690 [Planctomycetota bacterium]